MEAAKISLTNQEVASILDEVGDLLEAHEDDTPERQATVVTEYRGELAGRRVVRGREAETLEQYRSK